MHWSVSTGVSKSLSSGKPPRRGWPSLKTPSTRSLFSAFLVSSHFSLLSPHLYSLPPSTFLTFVLLSFDLSLFPLVHCFVPESLFTSSPSTSISASFCLCFRSLPPQPKRPPVLWDLISLQSKLQSLLGPEIQRQRVRDREGGIESVALQTHETTVASPLKRQAQWLGPEKLAGLLSTSLGAILNTNRRGLAVETKPWCHAAYFPWKAPGVLGPTPGDMRSP